MKMCVFFVLALTLACGSARARDDNGKPERPPALGMGRGRGGFPLMPWWRGENADAEMLVTEEMVRRYRLNSLSTCLARNSWTWSMRVSPRRGLAKRCWRRTGRRPASGGR